MTLFTCSSIENGPLFLRKLYNEKLIASFFKILSSASKGLGTNFSNLSEKIYKLDPNRK